MKKLITICALLMFTFSVNAQSKVAEMVAQRTNEIEQLLSLNKSEKAQIYEILLAKEEALVALRKQYKEDKASLKEEAKKLNKVSNRKMKDIIGGEKMQKMHAYFKAKREKANKE